MEIEIFCKLMTGRNLTLHVYEDSSVKSLKDLIELKNGTPANSLRLVFPRKHKKTGVLIALEKIEEPRKSILIYNGENFSVGQGPNRIRVLILNKPNCYIDMFYFGGGEMVGNYCKEIFKRMSSGLPKLAQWKTQQRKYEIIFKLIIGDKVILRAIEENGNLVCSGMMNPIDYYLLRNEVWSVSIKGVLFEPQISDFGIKKASLIYSIFSHDIKRLRRSIGPPEYLHGEKMVLECICHNRNCSKFKKKETLQVVSYNTAPKSRRKYAFDSKYDSEYTTCKSCESQLSIASIHFLDCFWRICTVKKHPDNPNLQIRHCTPWKKDNSGKYEPDATYRFHAEIRYYITNPSESYCVFCRKEWALKNGNACSHKNFHVNCLKKWNNYCPLCDIETLNPPQIRIDQDLLDRCAYICQTENYQEESFEYFKIQIFPSEIYSPKSFLVL